MTERDEPERVVVDLAEHRIRRQGRRVGAIAGPGFAGPDGLLDYLESLRDAIGAAADDQPDEIAAALLLVAHRIDGLTEAREQIRAGAMSRHPSRRVGHDPADMAEAFE